MRAALDCALGQSYPNKEVIIFDDGSTDSSLDIIKSYGERLRWASGPNRGISHVRNRLTEMSRGRFIMFYDTDDLMSPTKIEKQVEVALANPGCVVYGPWQYVWFLPDGTTRSEDHQTEPIRPDEDLMEISLRGWYCPPHNYLWPREAADRVGRWDESLCVGTDPDFAMRSVVGGERFVYAPDTWVYYHLLDEPRLSTHRTSMWLRSRVRSLMKIRRILEAEGRLTDSYRRAIAYRLDVFSRVHWEDCKTTAAWCEREARRISRCPTEEGRWHYRLWKRFFGVYCAENVAVAKRNVVRAVVAGTKFCLRGFRRKPSDP